MRSFSPGAWEAHMREIFGPVTPTVLEIESKTGKNLPETRKEHLRIISEHWGEIQTIIREELPPRSWVNGLMKRCGMPRYPKDLGLTVKDTLDAFYGSREIRDKYLTSSLLWDLGLMDETAEGMVRMLEEES